MSVPVPPPPFDPELAQALSALEGFVPRGLTLVDLPRYRELTKATREDVSHGAELSWANFSYSSFDGAEIAISVIKRRDHAGAGPAVYHMHGGGMIMGTRFSGAGTLAKWALEHGVVCATVEYRLAPEHPAPTAGARLLRRPAVARRTLERARN